MNKKLDRPAKSDELQDLQGMDYGLGDDWQSPNPFSAPSQRPAFQQPNQQLAPRSVNEGNTQIVLNKIDIVDAKIDELVKRLEVMEKLIQALHQQSSGQSPYKGYQRRTW